MLFQCPFNSLSRFFLNFFNRLKPQSIVNGEEF